MFKKPVDSDQTRQIFAADDIFRCIFLLGALRVSTYSKTSKNINFDFRNARLFEINMEHTGFNGWDLFMIYFN